MNEVASSNYVNQLSNQIPPQDHSIHASTVGREHQALSCQSSVKNCDPHFVTITSKNRADCESWTVGQLLSIHLKSSRVICQIADIQSKIVDGQNEFVFHCELMGEIKPVEGRNVFSAGISSFPTLGSTAQRIQASDLAVIYENTSSQVIKVGHLTQDPSIAANVDFEKLLSRHFAVVGSTGVGKSTAVSLILNKIIKVRENMRILLLDPHNEFSSAFTDNSHKLDAAKLALPFWLFTFEEFAEVIFRGQKGFEGEKELLRDLVTQVRQKSHDDARSAGNRLSRNGGNELRVSADTPVPYRIVDLSSQIDFLYGKLDNKHDKPLLRSLRDRVKSISNDQRFQFMFDPNRCGGDRLENVISEIFRIPTNGMPITVLEMSGIPSEVVNSVVSVLCRLSFDLAMLSNGAIQTLVVCEEAHRYIPSDPDAGFLPTRMSIGRIAKEGRKYGAHLGIITQRPSELDPTILSQCNTIFAMRLSNKADQDIISGAFTGGAQSTIAYLPSISNWECIAFGEAIYSPMRITFEKVNDHLLPGAHINKNKLASQTGRPINLHSVLAKMRGTGADHASSSLSPTFDDPYKEKVASNKSPLQKLQTNEPGADVQAPLTRNKPQGEMATSRKNSIVAGMKKREEELRRRGPVMTHINGKLHRDGNQALDEMAHNNSDHNSAHPQQSRENDDRFSRPTPKIGT